MFYMILLTAGTVILPLLIVFSKKDITIKESVSLCVSVFAVFVLFMINKLSKTKTIIVCMVLLWNSVINVVFFFKEQRKKKKFTFDKEFTCSLIERLIFFCEKEERERLINLYLKIKGNVFCDEETKRELSFLNAVAESYGVKRLFNDFNFGDTVVF